MEINYNFVSLIDFLALIQGVLLGIILILGNRKNRPSLLLGLFLITYSIELVPAILTDTGLKDQSPYLLFLPVKFLFLSPPLYYLYAKSLMQTISLKKNWIFFIPGTIEFLILTIIYLLPPSLKYDLQQSAFFSSLNNFYYYSSLIYLMIFCLLIILMINKHQTKVMNYFSNTENRLLKWVKAIAIFLITFSLSWFTLFLFSDSIVDSFLYPFLSAVNVIFIFWVGISGLEQSKVEMIGSNDKASLAIPIQDPLSPIAPPNRDDELFQQLVDQMKSHQLFKEPDLKLPLLAKELNITRKRLSQLINQKTGTNFNTFINQYRIEEAKAILVDSNFDHLNMLGIAYEVGFNSKATFFAVFKKIEGTSPGSFKKSHS